MVGANNRGGYINPNLHLGDGDKEITSKHELSKLQHGIYIATRILSKTCLLVLSNHYHLD